VRASLLLVVCSCASALHEPSPIAVYAPGRANGRTAAQLVAEADAAWARRALPGQAAAAQGLYLDAAVTDAHGIEGLLGAMRALSYRVEYEPGASRGRLAQLQVELGQWCQRRAPAAPACDYRLAIALGQQARERPSTGRDAMSRMVSLLHRTIEAAPRLEAGGPHRMLALLLLRAPSWPIGPGDPEAALEHARAAVQIAPGAVENQLALGEALGANGRSDEARAAYRRAAVLAAAVRDPEAARWLSAARAGIAKTGG
jgi:tetratricopeptide (TPR) repeat protein